MFQIISGKFFNSEDRFHYDCKIVLYSNAYFRGKHNLAHVSVESTELYADISTYVISYDNQLQKLPIDAQPAKVGDEEIAYQIANLLSFSLNCIWGKDKSQVEKLCAKPAINKSRPYAPTMFIPLTADLKREISDEKLNQADSLIKKLVGLSRSDYLNVMQCITAYNESTQHISTDVSLAYSMLVYILDSLAQKYDTYEATWSDYNHDIKAKLENALQDTDSAVSDRIKEILITDGQFKLSQRFRNFVISNIRDEFYDNRDGRNITNREDIIVALSNAYHMRSKYAHMLEPIMKLLTDGSTSKTHDTIEFMHCVYFTYSGLHRVVREVVETFFGAQPQSEFEEIAWLYQLPGSVEVQAAPYFWIWKDDLPIGRSAKAKFEGFIECLLMYKDHIPNMDTILLQYLIKLNEINLENRDAAFSLCWLYYSLINDINVETKCKMRQMIDKNKEISRRCNIYSLTSKILVTRLPVDTDWDTQTIEETMTEYREKKYKYNCIKLPTLVELMLYYQLANLFHDKLNIKKRYDWLQIAYDASNNIPEVRQEIRELQLDESVSVESDLLFSIFERRA